MACGALLGGVAALWTPRAPGARPASDRDPVSVTAPDSADQATTQLTADRDCLSARAALWERPAQAVPATNGGELRAQLFGRTKAEPVLFLQPPRPGSGPSPSSERARVLRASLELAPDHATFGRVVAQVRSRPELAREVFLSDGYLYTELPELAPLFGALTLSLLFQESEISISRGAQMLSARRLPDGDYEYTNGEERGKRAKLLLFDRATPASEPFGPARHVDVRRLAAELGFDEMEVVRLSGAGLAVDLTYAGRRVPALLRVTETALLLDCEALETDRPFVLARRAEAQRASGLHAKLVSVVKEQVDEALPFDEPKTEDGQQDGKLRPEWHSAYLAGSSSFEFNGDRYAVFDSLGRPRPPQVCIDFVLDTLERAGGTWWQSRDQPRRRSLGRLRFEESAIAIRRSVERFIDVAREFPAWFELYEVAADARVPFRQRHEFFSQLYAQRHRYKKGDIVAILGPRDDGKLHYHSFFILDADPVSGMPNELAANAGRPRIRSWEGEMGNAPLRSIRARLRPRQGWLESFLAPGGVASTDEPGAPPEPPAGPVETGEADPTAG